MQLRQRLTPCLNVIRSLVLVLLVLSGGAVPSAVLAAPLALAQAESAAPKPTPERFETPRETVEALLAIYDYERTHQTRFLEDASQAFQAREGLTGGERAREYARQLGRTFDHITLLDPERIERELITIDATHAEWTVASEVDPEFVVTLGFVKTDEHGWVIDTRTSANIYEWYTRAADLPRIEAIGDKPLSTEEFVRSIVPARLKGGGLLLEPWQWIGLLVLFLIAFFFERILTISVRPLVRKLSRFEGQTLPQDMLLRFERPFGWLLLAWLWLAGVQLLDLPVNVYAPLRMGVQMFTTVMTVWTAYHLADIACWPLQVKADRSENKFDDMLVPLLRRTLKIVIVLIGAVVFVSDITGDLWHILAGLSIGSLAIGFAAKDSVENLFGTFTVLLDGPFKIGDLVKMGDIEGTVEEVGFRSTRIRTPEDSLVTVPNSRFISSHVDCLGARRERRVKFNLGLTYDTPAQSIEAFCEGVRELVRAHPYTAKDSYHVWFSNFGASSLDVEVICFIETTEFPTFVRERHRLFLDILRLAQRLGVGFAFPTTTVWMGRAEDLAQPGAGPADRRAAIDQGRACAREVARESVGGLTGKPEPVQFVADDPDAIPR